MKFLAALALVVAGTTTALADPPDPMAAVVDGVRNDHWGYSFVERLTTEIGPRPSGSDRMAAAADWAEREMKAMGLENVHREPFTVTEWRRGTEEAAIAGANPQRLVIAGLGNGISTPDAGIDAEIVLFHRYDDLLAAAPGSLKGKIAVVTQRMNRSPDGSGYGAAVKIRVEGPGEASRRGALAYLLRSLGTDSHRLAHTGVTVYAADAPPIPAAALSNPDADQVERLAALGPVRIHLLLKESTREKATSWNIVGEVKGAERPGEFVVIGGHLDSWDLGTGAIDDGAGLAITASTARAIAHLPSKPRRSLRLVFFGGEERGQSGPAYFAAHKDELPHIVLTGEADFGGQAAWMAQLPKSAKDGWGKRAGSLLAPLGVAVSPYPAPFGGADFEPWADAGAAIIEISQDGWEYFDIHHTADDTIDKIDAGQLSQAAASWTAVIAAALNAKDLDR